ncbi:MAG: DUF928 domain-containing protein [Elainella sp. Prado103]|nr:DUF928 domain-containing protein [Elainella sp. Prado103]
MSHCRVALIILVLTLATAAQSALAQPTGEPTDPTIAAPQLKQRRPAPPSTPPPNRTRSGGSLGNQAVCTAGDRSLRALVPVENPVLTTRSHPTFWFYLPYGAEQVSASEFSVLVGLNETSRLYRAQVSLPDQPGLISITLPDLPEYALEPEVFYHWYFRLTCPIAPTSPTANPAMVQVDGWVQRVPLTPDRQRQLDSADPALWYDALDQVAQQRLTDPQNPTVETQWGSSPTADRTVDRTVKFSLMTELGPLLSSSAAILTKPRGFYHRLHSLLGRFNGYKAA